MGAHGGAPQREALYTKAALRDLGRVRSSAPRADLATPEGLETSPSPWSWTTTSYARPMSVWRRKALESFPELARELTSDDVDTTYAVWGEVFLPLAAEAYARGDADLLTRIFEYVPPPSALDRLTPAAAPRWCLCRRRNGLDA